MKLETHRSFSSELQHRVVAVNAQLSASHAIKQLWTNDHRLLKDDPTDTTNRLGWLTVIETMKDRIEELRNFLASPKKRGIRDVALLGMGGIRFGPEVLRASLWRTKGNRTGKK